MLHILCMYMLLIFRCLLKYHGNTAYESQHSLPKILTCLISFFKLVRERQRHKAMIIRQWKRDFCNVSTGASSKADECPLPTPNFVTAFAVCFLSFILHPCQACICLCTCLLFIYRITAQQSLLPFISFLHLLFPCVVLAIKPRKGYKAY